MSEEATKAGPTRPEVKGVSVGLTTLPLKRPVTKASTTTNQNTHLGKEGSPSRRLMMQCIENRKEAARLTPLLTARTTARLWERAGQEPVAKQILRWKWGWIRHTLRKPASSTTHQAQTWNPQGKRKRGRPRDSWRRDTEAELKQQGTNWTGMARAAQPSDGERS